MNETKMVKSEHPYTVVTNMQLSLSPEVTEAIGKIYPDVMSGKNGIIPKLKKLIGKYPDVKQFRNYLASAYLSTGNVEQAKNVNERLVADFPDYLFAKMFKAEIFLNSGEPELCRNLLGQNLRLEELHPERTEYHIAEFMTYQALAIKYFISIGNLEEAENRLILMEEQDANYPAVQSSSSMIMGYNLRNAARRWEEGEKYRRHPVVKSYNKETQFKAAPVFSNLEIEALYHHTLRIDPALISNILDLPRESLLEDLHLSLEDAVKRYEYFRDRVEQAPAEEQFPMHTMFILAELGSESSLPHLLNFMRQGKELLEFWLGDFLSEDVWEIFYHCGQNQLGILLDFVKEPNNYMYARTAVSTTVQQIALHQPERKTEVMEWYRHILDFMLTKAEDADVTDTQLNAFLISDIIPIGAEGFNGLITSLYKADIIDPDIVGKLEDVLQDIPVRRGHEYEKRVLFTDALSRYEDVLKTWNWYESGADLNPLKPAMQAPEHDRFINQSYQMPAVKDQKAGRNDPCPCGSGKKYKKCCMS